MAANQGALTQAEVVRYSRHLLLEEVATTGQQRLKSSRVLCVGCGGLGSSVLSYLAAAGVGRLGLVDFDVVDVSNLQRQIIHGSKDIGRLKVDSAADRIQDINPYVQVDKYSERLSAKNALNIFSNYDIIIDAVDNFSTRYLINDACVLTGKPAVYGSIYKFEGQLSVFNFQGGPHYRDLYAEPPPLGTVPSCAEAGVFGVLPGVIGTLQATEAIKILLGLGTSLSGRLLLYDALQMSFREIGFGKNPSALPITQLFDEEQSCEVSVSNFFVVNRISAGDLAGRLAAGWQPFILDVRTPQEAAIASLRATDRLCPHEKIADVASDLPKDRDIVVYCKLGSRSEMAAKQLVDLGFTRLWTLNGGIAAWTAQVETDLPRY